ncbi:MAG: nucleoside deaminase [Sphaerochaetaceae bacterium]
MSNNQNTMNDDDIRLLFETVKIARAAKASGNHPFGALLADKDGNILIKQGNEAFTQGHLCAHAETLLLFKAVKEYSPEFLSSCSLYSSVEPCVMCTGALYWSQVGRLVYGLSEQDLLNLTGNHAENPTFSLSSREVLLHGQKTITVIGPTTDTQLVEAIVQDHKGFWK